MKKILLAVTVFIVFSCNKEQVALNKLDGEWNVTQMSTSETDYLILLEALGITTLNYQFLDCDAGNTCDVYVKSEGTFLGFPVKDTDTLRYSLSDDASQLFIDDQQFDINNLTKSELEITGIDSTGLVIDIYMQKL